MKCFFEGYYELFPIDSPPIRLFVVPAQIVVLSMP